MSMLCWPILTCLKLAFKMFSVALMHKHICVHKFGVDKGYCYLDIS